MLSTDNAPRQAQNKVQKWNVLLTVLCLLVVGGSACLSGFVVVEVLDDDFNSGQYVNDAFVLRNQSTVAVT